MKNSFSHFFYPFVLSFVLILNISCATQEMQLYEPVEVNQDFMTLSDAIVARDVDLLWNLKESTDERISGAAWSALAVTQMDDLRELIDYAMDTDHPNAWYVLRFQDLSEEEIEEISVHFFTSDAERGPICSLFFSQDDRWLLDMLLENGEHVLNHSECAMAVGGMLTRIEAGQRNINRVMELLHESDDDQIKSFLLYGFWRSAINRPEPGSAAYEELIRALENQAASDPALVEEYLVRLTGERGLKFVMSNRSDSKLAENIQLSVELARSVRQLRGEELDKEMIYRLLNHPNPHVVVMTLESLKELENIDTTWIDVLSGQNIHFPKNAEVSITFLELLQKSGSKFNEMLSILEEIDQNHPNLKNRTLGLYKMILDQGDYLERVLGNLDSEGIEAYHSAIALTQIVERHANPTEIKDQVRETLNAALFSLNRSVITASAPIFFYESYYDENDQNLIMNAYHSAVENGNYSIAQILLGVMYEMKLVDDNFKPEKATNDFQKPEWQRIFEMGDNPLWILETNRGRIVIQLDPITAPFTVSSIDSLTRAGMYDGVDFHRVVRNFVIQGGDFDRRDGLGGPGYRLPTEPALYTFNRGKVGMASSGQDTEGSQFFITHTWTPHLDGYYTIFGEVIEGMDVVDRIQVGDVVLKAEMVW